MRVGLSLKRPARGRIKKLDRRSKSPDQRIRCRVVLKLAAGQRCNPASDGTGLRPVDGGAHRGAVRSRLDNRLACAEGNREAVRRAVPGELRGRSERGDDYGRGVLRERPQDAAEADGSGVT